MNSGWLLIVGLIHAACNKLNLFSIQFRNWLGIEWNKLIWLLMKSIFNNNQWNREFIQSELSWLAAGHFIQTDQLPLIQLALFAKSFFQSLSIHAFFIIHSEIISFLSSWNAVSHLINSQFHFWFDWNEMELINDGIRRLIWPGLV